MTLAMDEKQKTGALLLRTFRPGDEKPFKELNELWIVRHFALEDVDREVLDDPKGHILDAGGEICIAEIDGQVVGCCALLVTGSNEYELAKMTVSEAARGRGVGRNLLRYSIDHARTMGARRLHLGSNTKLADAIHLYKQMGFQSIATAKHESKYARSNISMEMFL
jgi:putative acetyltransferase